MKESVRAATECSHCKQEILQPVAGDQEGRTYCCYGCKVVDELLHGEGQTGFWDRLPLEKYRHLDAPAVAEKVLAFQEGTFARVQVELPAIHCSSCIYLLENLPNVHEGIHQVEVHFGRKEAMLAFDREKVALSQVAALLEYVGYTPHFKHEQSKKSGTNGLLVELGIAGFFFGNTMLLALPEYFDHRLAQDAQLQTFFRYLMMLFALPVTFYSGRQYFKQAWKALRAGSLSIDLPIAIGITVLFLRSSYEVVSGLGPGYFDSLSGLIFFLLLGKWYQQKTYQNFRFDRDWRSFLPLAVKKFAAGEELIDEPIEALAVDDCIYLRPQEIVPADAQMLSARGHFDLSYLTGESEPVLRKKEETVYAGARLIGAPCTLKIVRTVDRSYLTSLWGQGEASRKRATQNFTDRVSRYFTPAILIIALSGAATWSYLDPSKVLSVFTAVLIVACPCALALAEPFAQGSLMRWFGRSGFYLKKALVLNDLASINKLVFDKTGTLTDATQAEVHWEGLSLKEGEKDLVYSLATCSSHPLAQQLQKHLAGAQRLRVDRFEEKTGAGLMAQVEDHFCRLGSAEFVSVAARDDRTQVWVKIDDKVLGRFVLQQGLRPQLKESLSQLGAHYSCSLLSGDRSAELSRFRTVFPKKAELYFDQSPADKKARLEEWQSQGHKVAMIGDGLNDAAALQTSTVGISVSDGEVRFFPASDALLLGKAFGYLPQYLALAQSNQKLVQRAVILSFAYNLIGLSLALSGVLSPLAAAILMPLSSISVVLYTTLSVGRQCKKRIC